MASILIPTFNAEPFVARCVRSALAQTCRSIEVIVIDDASTDQTVPIVKRLAANDPRIIVVPLDRNAGPAAARNAGLATARGSWLAILDSDDLMATDRVERLIAIAEREGADIISDNLVEFADGDPSVTKLFVDGVAPGWIDALRYLDQSRLFGNGRDLGYLKPVFRAATLRASSLRYDERLRIAEDDDLIVRALLIGLKYWYQPAEGYFYRRHPGSTSHRLSVASAAAMCSVSAEVQSREIRPLERSLLAKRHAALERGLAFVTLIERLKSRQWLAAARLAWHSPRALPLLRMPLGAAIRRRIPALGRPAERRAQASGDSRRVLARELNR